MGKDWTEQFLDDTSAWKRRAGFKCVEAGPGRDHYYNNVIRNLPSVF